jgi:hypothetical protein
MDISEMDLSEIRYIQDLNPFPKCPFPVCPFFSFKMDISEMDISEIDLGAMAISEFL